MVKVHKRRTRRTVDSCMAEISDVIANGKPTRTIPVSGLGGYRLHPPYQRGEDLSNLRLGLGRQIHFSDVSGNADDVGR